jgi:hypothetical protein
MKGRSNKSAVREIPRTWAEAGQTFWFVMSEPALILWALYILFVPIYTFSSGLPQPGDLLVFLLAPAVIARWNGRLPKTTKGAIGALLAFTAWVTLVNVGWSAILGQWTLNRKWGFLISPTFYIYNALIAVVMVMLYQRFSRWFLWLTAQLVLISLVSQVAVSFVFSRGSMRGEVLFNNPNQLGYYAMLSASILMMAHRRVGLTTVPLTVGMLAAAYLSLFSASRAALAGLVILLAIGFLSRLRSMLIAAVLAVPIIFSSPFDAAIERTQDRVANDDSLGFFEERGYDRISAHPEYLVMGAGEGGFKRFEDSTAIGSHEMHSAYGTILFSYGIVGCVLFIVLCVQLVRGAPLRLMLMLLPAASYSVTHQGLRFTLLWVLLAFPMLMRHADLARRAERAQPAAPPGTAAIPAANPAGAPAANPAGAQPA